MNWWMGVMLMVVIVFAIVLKNQQDRIKRLELENKYYGNIVSDLRSDDSPPTISMGYLQTTISTGYLQKEINALEDYLDIKQIVSEPSERTFQYIKRGNHKR